MGAISQFGSLLVSISISKVADKTNNSGRRERGGGRERARDEVDIRDLERRAKMITM